MSSSRSATFSDGRTRDFAWMPVLRAFMEEAALPVTEVGPVDFWRCGGWLLFDGEWTWWFQESELRSDGQAGGLSYRIGREDFECFGQ